MKGRRSDLCAVLVPSCDAYSDLWQPFFAQFWRYWGDCPFPVYLGSNALSFDHPRVQVLNAGGGTNWTNRVREQVQAIASPYVLLMLEDFFLQSPVDTRRVLACLDALVVLDGQMVRLVPRPAPGARLADDRFLGRIDVGAPYRVSSQAAIWRRATLLELMREGESIWQFELDGTRRSAALESGFFGVWEPVLTYRHHVVERGKWFPWAARRFAKLEIGCDFSRRQIMSGRETIRWCLAKAAGKLSTRLPRRIRQQLVRLLRNGQVDGYVSAPGR